MVVKTRLKAIQEASDLAHSAITVTEERKKTIDFTDALYEVSSQLVAPKGSDIDGSDESLKGKTIGVLQGSVQETYARERWNRRSGVRVVAYMDQTQTISDLNSKKENSEIIPVKENINVKKEIQKLEDKRKKLYEKIQEIDNQISAYNQDFQK